jgi:hypothetical protein
MMPKRLGEAHLKRKRNSDDLDLWRFENHFLQLQEPRTTVITFFYQNYKPYDLGLRHIGKLKRAKIFWKGSERETVI